ncbi:unnamed protein product [Ectocarpus sp. 12 AP-2014]
MEGDCDDGSCNGSLPGWDGEELQYTDGWVTNWAGDSPKDPEKEAGAAVGTIVMADTLSATEKQARRNFYGNFTERALAKCGDYRGEKNIIEQDDVDRVEHEHILAWRAWVDLRHRVPKPSARLFCCPWAGGNSLMFERWSEELPEVEVVPLLLPGRLTRARENAVTNLSDIVTMVVEAICGLHLLTHEDISNFIYGHDFGALVAFEICRRVQDEFPMKALIVSSMSCPQMVHEREKMTSLCQVSPEGEILHAKNAEFESAMLRRGPPLPPEVLENKDLMEIFTPLWVADLSAVDTYEYKSGTLLECPIYSLGGIKDGEQDMSKWAMESSSGSSETTMFPGGSFFLLDRDNEVKILRLLRDVCTNEGNAVDDPRTT